MGKRIEHKEKILKELQKFHIPEEIEEEVIRLVAEPKNYIPKKETINKKNLSPESSLSWYLEEINKIPLLTREEEIKYAKLVRQGDKKAKEKLILANLRFVVSIAKRYQAKGITLLDLINEGNLGLIKAVEKYNPERGYHFISYAVWWIRQSILLAINQKNSLIRLPSNRISDLRALEKAEEALRNKLGRKAELEELAEYMNISIDELRNLYNIKMEYFSLDTTPNDDENLSFENLLEDKKNDTPVENLLKNDLHSSLLKVLDQLDSQERDIISLRFGITTGKAVSLEELGKQFNLSKERIRQIEKKALRRLRNSALASHLESYLNN